MRINEISRRKRREFVLYIFEQYFSFRRADLVSALYLLCEADTRSTTTNMYLFGLRVVTRVYSSISNI